MSRIEGLPPRAEQFLTDILRLQRRSERAQRQLASGLKLQTPADAPDDISRLLAVRASLEKTLQVQKNLSRVKTETDTAESALQTAVSLLERARTLGSQGASGHQSAATRRQVAKELEGILERLVAVTGTAVEGRYLFSGDSDQTLPYAVDLSRAKGVSDYQGGVATRRVADASGLEFALGQSAAEIFDSANDEENVFLAVNGMRRALLAVDDPPDPPDPSIPSLELALQRLGSAGLYLNQKLAGFGIQQNRVAEAQQAAQRMELNLRTQLAAIEEADLAEAAVELSHAKIHLEAAFQTRAQSPRRSLFDYLG